MRDVLKAKTSEQFSGFEDRLDDFAWMVDWKALGHPFCYVYLIGPSEKKPVKVGIANNCLKRLGGVQTGNWAQLFVHKAYLCADVASARKVEQYTHRSLTKENMTGEWFDLDVPEAASVVEWAAGKVGVGLASGVPDEHRDAVFDAIRSRLEDVERLDIDRRHALRAAKLASCGISLETIKAIRATECGF